MRLGYINRRGRRSGLTLLEHGHESGVLFDQLVTSLSAGREHDTRVDLDSSFGGRRRVFLFSR